MLWLRAAAGLAFIGAGLALLLLYGGYVAAGCAFAGSCGWSVLDIVVAWAVPGVIAALLIFAGVRLAFFDPHDDQAQNDPREETPDDGV
jgi:hypothetical protein